VNRDRNLKLNEISALKHIPLIPAQAGIQLKSGKSEHLPPLFFQCSAVRLAYQQNFRMSPQRANS
jgi:hypothetical protein